MSWQVKQQINFYTDEFRPPQLPDDIARLLLQLAGSAAVALVLALIVFGFSVWQGKSLDSAREQQTFLQQQLEQEKASRPPLSIDSGLQQQKEVAEAKLRSGEKILRYLTQGQLEESYSFTSMVEQLGDQDVKGVWLQSFAIEEQGARVSLAGYVDDPAKLSPYISSLVQRSAYRNKAFRFIDLQKNKANSWLKFELDTRAREKEEKDVLLNELAARVSQ